MLSCALCLRKRLCDSLFILKIARPRPSAYRSKFTCDVGLSSRLFTSTSFCTRGDFITKDSTEEPQRTYNTIFRFSGVRVGFFLHKLKWYQTLAASAAIPTSAVFYLTGVISSSWAQAVAISGILIMLNLYGIASTFHNAIGFIYLSEDETSVKISYLDYWGNRIDKECPVHDIVPFLDAPRPPTEFLYKQILFYSNEKLKPKLYLKVGQIIDKEKFFKVFGPLD